MAIRGQITGPPQLPGVVTSSPTPGGTTKLTETVAPLRFYEVVGRHLGSASFDDAIERAAREDPAGYAAYRQTTYTDGRREGI
jgi:hypothetical protein